MNVEYLTFWNPWWENPKSIKEFAGFPRLEYEQIFSLIDLKEILILTGVRRAGKSTLMYQVIDFLINKRKIEPSQILFINLDDPKLKDFSIEEIYECYRQEVNLDKKAFIFLDEVHSKTGWEKWLKKMYDSRENVKFFVSGSSAHLLRKEYSKLLTGRNITIEVFPLSFREFLQFNNIHLNSTLITQTTKRKLMRFLDEYLKFGGFPEVVLAKKEFKMMLLQQYFTDILYRDIIDRYNLNAKNLKDFTLFLMTNFTRQFSLRKFREVLGISYDSMKDYLNYLIEAYVFFPVEFFSYSVKEQLNKAPKIYVVDNGLRNATSFKFSEDLGKLVENLVFSTLRKRTSEVYYWAGQKEVDFVVKRQDNKLIAINVSYSNELNDREIKGLKEFLSKYKKHVKKLVVITRDIDETREGIRYVPLWKWLLDKKLINRLFN